MPKKQELLVAANNLADVYRTIPGVIVTEAFGGKPKTPEEIAETSTNLSELDSLMREQQAIMGIQCRHENNRGDLSLFNSAKKLLGKALARQEVLKNSHVIPFEDLFQEIQPSVAY